MFRVLGYLAGRAAAIAVDVYQRIQGNNQNQDNQASSQSFIPAAIVTVGVLALPPPLRIPAVLGLAFPYLVGEAQELVEEPSASPSPDASSRGLACYLRAIEDTDPYLLGTARVNPFAQCRD